MWESKPSVPHQRHLVTVWNPSYTSDDVMDAHVEILLRSAAESREAGRQLCEAYVWWGKLRSANREQSMLTHEQDLLEIEAELAGDGGADREVQLYLTDYRSLYVGHVDEITRENVIMTEADRVPEYYASRGYTCDCWFKLLDIRRVVADDLLAVIEGLKQLRNRHYHGKPVSLYGGMVNLPLVVERPDGARFFDPEVRYLLADGMLWAEFDAARAGDLSATGALQRDLRENLFGDEAWSGLAPAAREFVASAERLIRMHRGDASFDFSGVVLNFAKAIEVQCKAIISQGLEEAPYEARLVKVRDRTIDVVEYGLLTVGELLHALNSEPMFRRALAVGLRDGSWFVNDLPRALAGWPDVRNRAAHSEPIARQTALAWRNDLVGVGCGGVLVRLGAVRAFNAKSRIPPLLSNAAKR